MVQAWAVVHHNAAVVALSPFCVSPNCAHVPNFGRIRTEVALYSYYHVSKFGSEHCL